MRGRAVSRVTAIQLSGIRLRVLDEFRDGRHTEGRLDHHHVRDRSQARERDEVALHVVRKVGFQRRQACEHGGAADEQRVAVGCGRFRDLDADDAARTRSRIDDELLPHLRGELVGHDAGDDVGRAAGGVRNDDAHRTDRVRALGCGACTGAAQHRGEHDRNGRAGVHAHIL
jgi:hypothetical protein